jgi:hypothetical protein
LLPSYMQGSGHIPTTAGPFLLRALEAVGEDPPSAFVQRVEPQYWRFALDLWTTAFKTLVPSNMAAAA